MGNPYKTNDDDGELTGWFALTRYPSLTKLIDTFLDLEDGETLSKTDLGKRADISRKSVARNIEVLVEAEVAEPDHGNGRPPRYGFNATSDVSLALILLDGESRQTLTQSDEFEEHIRQREGDTPDSSGISLGDD